MPDASVADQADQADQAGEARKFDHSDHPTSGPAPGDLAAHRGGAPLPPDDAMMSGGPSRSARR
jgi:hypothetical protein